MAHNDYINQDGFPQWPAISSKLDGAEQKATVSNDVDAIIAAQKGAINGIAPLDDNALISIDNLPIASSNALGVIKVGTGLTISSGVLNATNMAETVVEAHNVSTTAHADLFAKAIAGRNITIVIAGANATTDQKAWADGVCTGTSSNCIDDVTIQALIDAASAAGYNSIEIKAFGTFWIGVPIRIPYGVNFYVEGEGIPNVDFNIAICTTTPSAGTQFRSTAAWNTTPWYGTCNVSGMTITKVSGALSFETGWVGQLIYINNVATHVASVDVTAGTLVVTDSLTTATGVVYYYCPSIFVRVKPNPVSGIINAKGQTRFENLALMPAWGDAAYTVPIYGLTDEYAATLILDNFMFLPWGWFELSQPAITQATNVCKAFNCQGGTNGGGTNCDIGTMYIYAHGGAGLHWESFIGYDCVHIKKIMMYGCYRGILFQDAWFNVIDDLIVYASQGFAVSFNTTAGHGNIIHRLNYESLSLRWMSSNPLVYLNSGVYVQIDYFFNWPSTYSSNITSITNDDLRIEKSCYAFNLGNSGIVQSVPRSVVLSTPFGAAISAPFYNGSYPTVGNTGGTSASPTSGTTYFVREPVDITVSGGTGVSITVKDAYGNTIDDAVTTLTHRLLLGCMRYTSTYWNTGYSICITYTTVPTITVVNAMVGFSGTSASPLAGVNYVAGEVGTDISFSGGTDVSAEITDNSTTTGGEVLDAGLTSMVNYHLAMGQKINFGAFSVAPTNIVVRRHCEL
jgi:hypothetical protein